MTLGKASTSVQAYVGGGNYVTVELEGYFPMLKENSFQNKREKIDYEAFLSKQRNYYPDAIAVADYENALVIINSNRTFLVKVWVAKGPPITGRVLAMD